MNIKRAIKKSNLEERIRSFTKTIPLSLCIRDENKKTILFLSNNGKEPSFNYPITFKGKTIGELNISEKDHIAEFILQLINDILVKEYQIAEINDETLLMYREINLLYNLSTIISGQMSLDLDNRLDYLMEKCVKNLRAENTSLWFIKDDILQCTHSKGNKPERIFKLGEGVIGGIAISGKGEMLNYLIDDPRWSGKINEKASIIIIPLRAQQKNIGVLLMSKHNKTPFAAKDLKLANVFAHHSAQEIENNRLLEKIKKETILRTNLSRFLSPNIVELLADGQYDVSLGGDKRTVTILFSDIVNFTSLSERLDSEVIVEMLNEYFTSMTEIIFKFYGTLDKFIGDSIMAFFGAPRHIENHAILAVKAGLLMQETNAAIQYNRRKKGNPDFQVRIGINTGVVTVGNIGSPNRLDYTAVGDIVNITSRIESATPPGGVLIGEATYELVKDSFKVEDLNPIKVKGKTNPLKVYKVLESY